MNGIPLKDRTDTLSENLKKGTREPVVFLRGGKEYHYYIEANPQFKTINVYDEHLKKVELSRALGIRERNELRIHKSASQGTSERQGKVRRVR